MRPIPTTATPLALAALLALASCGSGATRTVSISSREGSTAATTGGGPSARSAPEKAKAGSTQTGPTQTTRTATAPAFAKEAGGGGGEGLNQAVAAVKARGYTPQDTAQYHSDQTLRVLLATRTGSADGYAQQAFFFLDDRYIGTDTGAPSAGIKLVSQGDTEVTLAYRLYRPGDPLCCGRGGEADVRFQLDNGRLVPLDPIPPVDSSTAPGRR
jgi:hypothetical protein